ncbi:MAG: transcription-repair coupling factor [Mycobacteriales bacterium]
MSLAPLLDVVAADPALGGAVRAVGQAELELTAASPLRPFALAALVAGMGRTVLAVTATGRESEDLAIALRSLLPADTVVDFPAWETLPHERLSPRADTVGRRIGVLRRLTHAGDQPISVVVAPIRSLLQPMVAGLGDLEPIAIKQGETHDLDGLVRRLVDYAYLRVELVEKRGEFAVRGGILDVFAPTDEHPLRIEFWGDEVEEIRSFAAGSQRSLGPAEHGLWAPPCRELLLTEDVRARARALADEHPELADVLDKLADGTPTEGMEAFAPVLVDRLSLLVDELPAGAHVVVCDPERVRTRAHELVRTSQEFLEASWSTAAIGGKAPVDLGAAAYRTVGEVREAALAAGLPWWTISPFAADETGEYDDSSVIEARTHEGYRGDTAKVLEDIRGWLHDGWRVVLLTEGHGPAERLHEVLQQAEIGSRLEFAMTEPPPPSIVVISCGSIERGFASTHLKLAVLTETDLSGQRGSTKDMRKMPSKRRKTLDIETLKPGDFVVHEQHGVGRYVEMVRRTINGAEREYLILEYARGDRLFVPTDQLEQVTRYVGGEQPTMHRLGGADWQKAKGRAKKAIKEIAAELIRLYSARMASPGYAFGADTPWQRELEDAFPYTETPDQLAAINDVKADMQSAVPMDRVICGDVGYGKTEIAVRAAFKAVMDGKQAAILVPTTLLAQQHFGTFSERFGQFPVSVKMVSRFNSAKEQAAVLTGVADGSVDVVIGTHRLLSKGTKFKDLGLVIVDEEQRFGVEHKEYLKSLRVAVDVLTMSATPIPRTLEMAITGIRELSTIDTPPEERHPVLTFVGPYDDKQIAAAIRRELLREGQVFFIHNRVESIDRVARRISELVPEARVTTAHGQMNEDALEHVMLNFWDKQIDVLVCTTIVESGIDIANANTLIVERADVMGLSQLHQLRGRVGRGRERAYAYFLYSPEKPLTELAYDRLATIAQNNELGAGIAVAMKDLEIRGAGNLLGGEQSGHIAAVGFDLYVRLVGEAVADFKGESTDDVAEVKIDLPVAAHLPHDYIPEERLRLEAYRRIAGTSDEASLTEVRAELVDRYGPFPSQVQNLLAVAEFRLAARARGLTEVSTQGRYIRFAPLELRESQQLRLERLYRGSIVKPAVRTVLVPKPDLKDIEALAWARDLLDAVLQTPAPASA